MTDITKQKLIDQVGSIALVAEVSAKAAWPTWLQGLQTDAAETLRKTGLPHKRVEG